MECARKLRHVRERRAGKRPTTPPSEPPASHWPAKESAWRASSPKTRASENHEPIPSDRLTCACPPARTIRHIVMRGNQKFRRFRVLQNEGIRETTPWLHPSPTFPTGVPFSEFF